MTELQQIQSELHLRLVLLAVILALLLAQFLGWCWLLVRLKRAALDKSTDGGRAADPSAVLGTIQVFSNGAGHELARPSDMLSHSAMVSLTSRSNESIDGGRAADPSAML